MIGFMQEFALGSVTCFIARSISFAVAVLCPTEGNDKIHVPFSAVISLYEEGVLITSDSVLDLYEAYIVCKSKT
jgi:hypothetical protein